MTKPRQAPKRGRPRKQAATSSQALQTASRVAEAVRLRRQGYTLEEVAQQLQITRQAVHQLIKSHLRTTLDEAQFDLDEMREAELEKLDDLYRQSRLAVATEKGVNVKAIAECRALVMDRAKLAGLLKDKVETELTVSAGVFAIPLVPESVEDWQARALAGAADEEAKAEELLKGTSQEKRDGGA